MPIAAIKPSGLRFEIARQLLLAICRGEIAEGERLTIKWIAAEFGVSTTPAREALLELAGVGAIDLLPNRGAVVRRFGHHQILEIYDVRRLLEVEAVRRACGRLPIGKLEALRTETLSLLKEGPSPHLSERAVRSDRELHQLVAEYSGQGHLAYEIGRIGKLISAVRGLLGDVPHIKKSSLEEHLTIIDALLTPHQQRAMEAMRIHIQSTCLFLLNEVFPGKIPFSTDENSSVKLFAEA